MAALSLSAIAPTNPVTRFAGPPRIPKPASTSLLSPVRIPTRAPSNSRSPLRRTSSVRTSRTIPHPQPRVIPAPHPLPRAPLPSSCGSQLPKRIFIPMSPRARILAALSNTLPSSACSAKKIRTQPSAPPHTSLSPSTSTISGTPPTSPPSPSSQIPILSRSKPLALHRSSVVSHK